MLAPNPNTRKPPKWEPWETPADLPAMRTQNYGHMVSLELGMRTARRHYEAAANIMARPVNAMVWANGVLPFTNFVEAARFVIGAGQSAGNEDSTATAIRRAMSDGRERYGLRWKAFPESESIEPLDDLDAAFAGAPVKLPRTVKRIMLAVANSYELSPLDLIGRRRNVATTTPRHVCAYLLRLRTEYSLEDIGGFLGGRDHSTTIHSCRAVAVRMEADPRFAERVHQLDRAASSAISGRKQLAVA